MSGYDSSDTIVAPATAPGRSAIAILRLSGPGALCIAHKLCPALPDQIEPRRAYVADVELRINGGELTDRAVAVCWRAPDSYTGEDLVELSLHGNPLLLREATAACVKAGARLAEAGEFTYRAYLGGKLDLSQAEAVQELISAGSIKALRLAGASLAGMASKRAKGWVERLTTLLANIEVIHDYAADDLDASIDPETMLTPDKLAVELEQLADEFSKALEDSRRTAPLREGVTVALCGPPNVGKSTLFNALIGHERALTHEQPGTTRDYLSETLTSGGFNLTLIDTAGWREAADAVEAAGIAKAGDWARAADVVLWVVAHDRGEQAVPDELAGVKPLAVMTRCDLLEKWPDDSSMHCVSGKTGRGVPELWQLLRDRAELTGEDVMDSFSQRQAGRIEAALAAVDIARTALGGGMPLDAVAQDMYAARHELHGIYEQEDRYQVIDEIFSGFCVGK